MAVTRINNNQITDASAGNVYLGINANTKLQNFSITSNKIANNLTYGSDLTVSGNLTVNGTSTAIDTTITTIEDPVIVLASTQTGSPTVDIGFLGERGTANNIAFVWNEANSEFVTAFTNTSETNTTISILAYANLHTNNMVVGGTTSLIGNVVGATNFTGNVTGGNLLTAGIVSATGNVAGGNITTVGNISATGNIAGGNIISGNAVIGNINVSGDITVNSLTSNTFVSATGNVVSGNVTTSGLISATGTVTAGNISTAGTVTAASTVGGVITGSSSSVTGTQTAASTVGGVITGSSSSVTGTQTAASTVGGVITGSSSSVTGSQTAASTVGGVITGSSVSVTGNVTASGNVSAAWLIGNIQGSVNAPGANTEIIFNDGGVSNATSGFTFNKTSNLVTVGGNVNATNFNGNVYGTSVSASGTVTAASTVGGVITGTSTSVTGSQTAASTVGGVITGSSTSVTGSQTAASTVGGVITGSSSSVTGTQTAASTVGGVITGSSSSVTGAQTAASTVGGIITGSSVSVTGNVTGGNLVSATVTNPTAMTVSTNAGNINLEPTGNIVVNNTYINGLQLTPQQDGDAASKYYVDTIATTGLTFHEAVTATTTTTLATATGGTITYTQPNGVSNGVGAYLQTTGTFTFIDTANVQTVGTRILVKDQANAVQNGVYVYSNATAITRSSDTDQYGSNSVESFSINDYFFTTSGNVNAGAAFVVDAPAGVITFGTSNISFAQFSSSQTYTANTSAGLVLINQQFNAKVDNNTTAFDGLGNISVKAGANLTTPNIGAATGTSLSVTGTVTAASTVGGVITGSSSSVTGTQTAASTVGGVITGSSVSVSGNVTAGNVNSNVYGTTVSASGTVTAASTVGGVITGSSSSVTGTQTAASTVGGVITGSSSSVTGTQTAASTVGGVITGSSSSVTGSQTAASTVGGVITGSSTSVTGSQTAASTVGGVITGSSVSVTGNVDAVSFNGNVYGTTVSASGNITGGNLLTSGSGGAISGTGNITGGNILTAGNVSATGNVTASWLIGNIQGSVNAPGANTEIIFNDGGVSNATAGFTFNKTSNLVTVGGNVNATNFNGNVFGTSVSASGTVTAASTVGGVITGSSASVTGTVTAASTVGGVITGSTASLSGNVTAANLVLTTGFVDGPASGRITINGSDIDTDFAVDGDTLANVFYVDAGTGTASFGSSTQVTNAIVNFATTTSIKAPVGNTAQRPATGVTGMLRFNTTTNSVEVYDNSAWTSVGAPTFTVIADQQFNGDGAQVAFTLSSTQTTNSCIVSINGVVQIPTLAYAVAGTNPTCVLTFTEAPAIGDVIDVRQITTTTSVTSIANSSGNAVVAVSDTSATTTITGDLVVTGNATITGNVATNQIQNGSSAVQIPTPNGNVNFDINSVDNVYTFGQFNMLAAANITPTANVTYNLGTTTNRWKDLWLANSTIYMGNAQISANATSLIFTTPTGGQTVFAGSTGGDLTVSNIINSNANGVGNIGSSTAYFNTVFAKATSAQYADLAEKYTADAAYTPGTVLVFGGTAEVTVNAVEGDRKVAGVVSTNPSYIMNAGLEGNHVATVALTGRVPTLVVGPVRKGDLMVAAGLGRARAEADPKVGSVIGKALEDFAGAEGTIEVVVGRF
jgi:mucin-19